MWIRALSKSDNSKICLDTKLLEASHLEQKKFLNNWHWYRLRSKNFGVAKFNQIQKGSKQ